MELSIVKPFLRSCALPSSDEVFLSLLDVVIKEMQWDGADAEHVSIISAARDRIKILTLPKPAAGYSRQWLRCRTCQTIQFYDFVPYSFSNPIMTTTCGHGLTERDLGCDSISAEDAMKPPDFEKISLTK